MSESVVVEATLEPVAMTEVDLIRECVSRGIVFSTYESPLEALLDGAWDDFQVVRGLGLCRVLNYVENDLFDERCPFKKNPDGSYHFKASYYNGCTFWRELVEGELDSMGSEE